jgi:3-oxo-5-alpha-steroid 4-dehydrogenase 1
MIVSSIITFAATTLIAAPYGRYSASKGWGPLLTARFAWIVMESPNLLIPIAFLVFGVDIPRDKIPNLALLMMFCAHYINRVIIYPLRLKGTNPMPASVCILAFLYCSWNGVLQTTNLLLVAQYPTSWLSEPRFILGLAIFCLGAYINISSDNYLVKLRQPNKGYVMPMGGLFEYVSCANYTGEILEWTGYAIASWSLPASAFAVFTFCNIGTRGYTHHQWYKSKFENYPLSRKAVIPFIW